MSFITVVLIFQYKSKTYLIQNYYIKLSIFTYIWPVSNMQVYMFHKVTCKTVVVPVPPVRGCCRQRASIPMHRARLTQLRSVGRASANWKRKPHSNNDRAQCSPQKCFIFKHQCDRYTDTYVRAYTDTLQFLKADVTSVSDGSRLEIRKQ